MENRRIREAAQRQRIKFWEIAMELGITDTTLSRKLRRELPEEEQQRILAAIKRVKEKDGAAS